jgi:uncharacterized SAM-dependent methyltransferase
MHDAETQLLEKHKSEIVSLWPAQTALLDLGCGAAEKSLLKLVEARAQGKRGVLHAVDVNGVMLSEARRNADAAGIEVRTHSELMENVASLAALARDGADAVYFNIGANYANFPVSFLDVIRSEMRPGDFLYLSAQLRGSDTAGIVAGYKTPGVRAIADGPLRLAGFRDGDFRRVVRLAGDTVETVAVAERVPRKLARIGVHAGDEFVTVRSRKPSLDELRSHLSAFRAKVWTNAEKSYAIAVASVI